MTNLQINSNTEIPNRWEHAFWGIVINLDFVFGLYVICFLELILSINS
jgi:hypothetical protein